MSKSSDDNFLIGAVLFVIFAIGMVAILASTYEKVHGPCKEQTR